MGRRTATDEDAACVGAVDTGTRDAEQVARSWQRCPVCASTGHVGLTDDGAEQPATTDREPERVLP